MHHIVAGYMVMMKSSIRTQIKARSDGAVLIMHGTIDVSRSAGAGRKEGLRKKDRVLMPSGLRDLQLHRREHMWLRWGWDLLCSTEVHTKSNAKALVKTLL